MILVLVRHAQAIEAAPGLADADRWLTGKGRKIARKVGAWLAKPKRRPAAIWTSPLVRSVQTAEILAGACDLVDSVSVCSELSPGRDPGDLLRVLAEHREPSPLVLVGHEPSLSLVVTSLLSDPSWKGFRKGGALAVEWSGSGKAERLYMVDPAEL
ncbi:MAG: histidine phosphatase family protein [Polyangiaceae bacterium]